MTRVSTFGNYQSALLDLMASQSRGFEAQKRVSTQKVATDLSGFGRTSETVTAMKSSLARVNSLIEVNKTVAGRLESQDLQMNRVGDAAQGAREAIANALAAGNFDTLMQDLEGQFQIAREGLNSKHNGQYLFAGGATTQAPVTANSLSDLTAAADLGDLFTNDTLKTRSRVDETTTVETGFLADELGTGFFQILRDIQAFHEATPVAGSGDDAMKAFLTDQLARLDSAHETLVDQAARNGGVQSRLDTLLESQTAQAASLDTLLGDRTDADMAQALTDLEAAQQAIQASALVLNSLKETSLLYLLR